MNMQEHPDMAAFRSRLKKDLEAGMRHGPEFYLELYPALGDAVRAELSGMTDEATIIHVPGHDGLDPLQTTMAFAVEDDSSSLGESLGHYRILGELGRGGQGRVYLARDERLGRRVALKVLNGFACRSQRQLMRFRREAEVVSTLDDPGICTVFETGMVEGVPYIAMQYVEGSSLATILRELRSHPASPGDSPSQAGSPGSTSTSSWSARDFVRIVRDVARSLHSAHERSLVHRDVKPANIMVTDDGRPIVLDFGIAHSEDEDSVTLTRSGDQIGTPAYMAPEQIDPGIAPVDRRTDVYALGVTLFECLTLSRPFVAPTREALYQEILAGRMPAASSVAQGIDRDLDIIIRTATNADINRRYDSGAAFADDLDRYLRDEPIKARPASWSLRLSKWAARNPEVAVLLVTVLILLVSGLVITTALWRQSVGDRRLAEQETRRADDKAREARRHLAGYEMLSDGHRYNLFLEQMSSFYPPHPSKVPRIDAWLKEVRAMVAREPLYRRQMRELESFSRPMPLDRILAEDGHADVRLLKDLSARRDAVKNLPRKNLPEEEVRALGSLEQSLGRFIDRLEASNRRRLEHVFQDADKGWQYSNLKRLLRCIEVLKMDREPLAPVASILLLRRQCLRVEKESLQDAADLWQDAIRRISDEKESPLYRGLRIEPQLGLVPLGPDPESGLWEFAHVLTGDIPGRSEQGRLKINSETAVVLVLLPGGTAVIGSDELPRSLFALPPRTLVLDPFFIAKHEFTSAQWEAGTGDSVRLLPGENGVTAADFKRAGRLPQSDASWQLVEKHVHQLGLALPTDVQWEYACRAGTTTGWWCGNDPPALQDCANINDDAARVKGFRGFDDGFRGVAVVDSMRPNPFGLHHMMGNVWELTRDGKELFGGLLLPGDGLHTLAPPEDVIIRGGSFRSEPDHCQSASRATVAAQSISHSIGFRVARPLQGNWWRP